jgi:hypothetical protein
VNADEKRRAEIDLMLAPPEEKEKVIGKQNQQAMQALAGFGPMMPPPPPRPS